MKEYRKFRCCMCPNSYKNPMSRKCPPGPFKNEVTLCRFVKAYVDDRGWKYKVMSGIGDEQFKTRFQKPDQEGDLGWKGVRSFKWRQTFDEAQSDLNEHAREKGWDEIDL